MSYTTILLEKIEGIAKITLNRPEAFNAINPQMVNELAKAIEDVKKDPNIKVLVITGSGKAFSAGGDIKAMPEMLNWSHVDLLEYLKKAHEVISTLLDMDKITIAAINGVAAGAGLSLALACDMRIASENARLTTGFIRVGLHTDCGVSYFIARLTNPAKALELILTSDLIDAKEAERLGLVNKVVPPEKLEEEVMNLAKKIAQGPLVAIKLLKRTVYESIHVDLKTILEREALAQALCFKTEDAKEGITAFAEKRQPQFRGK
ncbi:MAG: enoyl-CoA hydratase/isomerase family protein [Candidatus Nezhaarchaeales archaeon]